MAPGIFDKFVEIIKKPFEFVKKKVFDPVVEKVVKPLYQKVIQPVYKTLKPVLKPIMQTVLQTKGIPAPATDLLFEGGEGLADHFFGKKEDEGPPPSSRTSKPARQTVYVDENGNPISEEDLKSGMYGDVGGEVMSASAAAPSSTVDLMRSNLRRRK
jgi:hypothetical protein